MNFAAILGVIQLTLSATTELAPLIVKTREWINALFSAGVITAAEQNRLHAICDEHMNARLRGERPPALVVDPD